MGNLTGQKIGFIGLGLMGKPMCRNLLKANADLYVTTRNDASRQEMAGEGATACPTPASVAEATNVIIIMVADTPAVENVLLGQDGVIEGIKPGSVVIDMGTTAVPETRRFAETVEAKGGLYVDAPVSGGTIGAIDGTLVIMAGGTDEAMSKATPALEAMSSRITHVGSVGAGQVAKAANQVIVGLNIGAVSEALALAKAAGVDPAKVREALQGGFADSRILEVHGNRMVTGDFTPGGKCTTQRKDMTQALELAKTLDLEMPATALTRDLYDQLIKAGHGDLDHAALFKLIDNDL